MSCDIGIEIRENSCKALVLNHQAVLPLEMIRNEHNPRPEDVRFNVVITGSNLNA
jgi:hypothetical protein